MGNITMDTDSQFKGNHHLFHVLITGLPMGCALCELVFDTKGHPNDYRYLVVNAAFSRSFGLEKTSFSGKSARELFPDTTQAQIEPYAKVVATDTQTAFLDYNHHTKNDSLVTSFSLKEKKFAILLTDLAKEKKVAPEQPADDLPYRQVFDSMYEMFQVIELVYNKNGKVIDYYYRKVNPAFEHLVQKKSTELIGQRAKAIFGVVEDYWLETYQRVDETGKPEHFENYGVELDKYYKIIAWKIRKGSIAIIFTDDTERKKEELTLIKDKDDAKEDSRLKSAFLSNMSHEIRTPMNGILGFTSLLKEKNLTQGKVAEYTAIIEKSGARMLNTINDIIDISKIESGLMKLQMVETNLNDQIDYLYHFFKLQVEAKGLQLVQHCALDHEKTTIYTDREKIFAILTNLLKNAVKYTTEGSITFGYEKKVGFLEFYVKDTGIGIEKQLQEKIFGRFMQVENYNTKVVEGTGLGLAISKAYVEMLGGQIRLESSPGKGSVFFFTLPFEIEKQAQVPETITTSPVSSAVRKLHVLVVDDDKTSNYFLELILVQKGHKVYKANTGLKAVELCRANSAIDLVLMDIRMSELNGYEATKQIREFNSSIIIIAQTAFGLAGDRERSIAAGCNTYLTKPIDQFKLFALIDQYFGY